jgi:hypothetical protein
MKAILSRHIIYADILYFNSDLNEAKLKEKAHLFRDSFFTKVLVSHIIRKIVYYCLDGAVSCSQLHYNIWLHELS